MIPESEYHLPRRCFRAVAGFKRPGPPANNPRNIKFLLGEGSTSLSMGTLSRFQFSQLAGSSIARGDESKGMMAGLPAEW